MPRIWVTAGDDKVCPECVAMDGAILPDGEEWDTPPGEMHTNCRCMDIYVSKALLAGLGIFALWRREEDAQSQAERPYQGGVSERELMGFGEMTEAEYDEFVESEGW